MPDRRICLTAFLGNFYAERGFAEQGKLQAARNEPDRSPLQGEEAMATVASGLLVWLALAGAKPQEEPPPENLAAGVEVEFRSLRSWYLLAEPVVFLVRIKNTADRRIHLRSIHLDSTEPEINIYVSRNGKTFRRRVLGLLGHAKIVRQDIHLNPGEEKIYILRVLYDHRQRSRLAFPECGVFHVKAALPLILVFKKNNAVKVLRLWRTTETIRIAVVRPVGPEKTTHDHLTDKKMLAFVQLGIADKKTLASAIRIAQEARGNPYYDDLLWALRQYYQYRNCYGTREPFPEREALERLLGIRHVNSDVLTARGTHSADRRLDFQQVTLDPGRVELRRLFEQVTLQTGTPLSLGHSLSTLSEIKISGGVFSLRQFMQTVAEPGFTTWVRHGNGYRLEAVPRAENPRP